VKSFKCPISKNFFVVTYVPRDVSWHIAVSGGSGYAAMGIHYTEKSFMKLSPGANFIKPFTAIIYAIFSKLP
jgi:hypothetical protein